MSRQAKHNAVCLDGPCHGMLTYIDQDVGVVVVELPGDPQRISAPYRITRERVHHPSSREPFTALCWEPEPDPREPPVPDENPAAIRRIGEFPRLD